eukprot:NODE_43_length_33755_cov_1.178542.p4 type:complete len:504 gc:universal NODE_43_length_33755_cov_1.178542:25624-24113(-)
MQLLQTYMEVAQYHLEKMLPDLKELQDKNAFSQEQVDKIIEMRKKYEFRIHRRITLESDYDQYIHYEKSIEAMRYANTIGNESYKSTRADRSIKNRIMNLYSKLCYRFPSIENHSSFVEWLIKNKMSNRASSQLTTMIRLFPNNASPYLKSAEYEMIDRQNHMGAKAVLLRGLRFVTEDVDMLISFAKLECIYIQKVYERSKLISNTSLEFDKSPQQLQNMKQIENYSEVFNVLFKKVILMTIDDVAKFVSLLDDIFLQLDFIPQLKHLQKEISLECFKKFGEDSFKSKLIEILYNNSQATFVDCVKEYELLCDNSEIFVNFQNWLLSIDQVYSHRYIVELINSDSDCITRIYELGARMGCKKAFLKLKTESVELVLQSDYSWGTKIDLISKLKFEEKDIDLIINQFAENNFKLSDKVYRLISDAMLCDESIMMILNHPKLRYNDIFELIKCVHFYEDNSAKTILKFAQDSNDPEIWQHLMSLFKPNRHLYLKAAKKYSSLVN